MAGIRMRKGMVDAGSCDRKIRGDEWMENQINEGEASGNGLKKYLSPMAAWGLSFGCAVGWGAFVLPGNTFLPVSGPAGTVLGMLLGGLIMLIIGASYHFLMQRYPDCGGTFAYVKAEMGYDRGFLSTWFLILVYIAIIWANATAIPLLCKNLLRGIFEVGPHYEVAGFDVYVVESLISVCAVVLAGLICMAGRRLMPAVQTVMALILICGILYAAGMIFLKNGIRLSELQPYYSEGNAFRFRDVLRIVTFAPWAYAGFESISHSAEEFRFPVKRTIIIFAGALLTAVTAYALLSLIAVSAVPEGFSGWKDYLDGLGSLSGLEGVPSFYAVHTLIGDHGLVILGITVAAGIMTGLVGNMAAASRLLYSMAREQMLPERFGRLNRHGVPVAVIVFITLISLPITFFGRTAIGWIIDVNTVGAAIAYAYTCAAAGRAARREENRKVQAVAAVGLLISLFFTVYFLVPNFWSLTALATESYMILIVWSILGFFFFRHVFEKDTKQRFGQSAVVWIALLFLTFFVSMLWFREATQDTTRQVLDNLNEYNQSELRMHEVELDEQELLDTEYYLGKQIQLVDKALKRNSLIQMGVIFVALFIMFNIYHSLNQRERRMELEKVKAEESSRAKSTFLSNMSHDIRTPMNAIVGYTALTRKMDGIPAEAMENLNKIEVSSKHLLALINDILDMSRIESGKMELAMEGADLWKAMKDVENLFATQMEQKKIRYQVQIGELANRYVLCDVNYLNRVLLNLISNAFKFTPEGGSVTVSLEQTGAADGKASYELRVKDSGMGMTPEFASRVFEAYTRERTVNNIQGTGLGMAITKNIVDLMGGTIEVKSEQNVGTEFIIHVDFEISEDMADEAGQQDAQSVQEIDFSKFRLLLTEDQIVNRELAAMILTQKGFMLEYAENGKEAVEKVAASKPGYFQAVLMDIQMPVMNGYEAARAIRALEDPGLNSIPIIAMTANAFSEDIQAAKDAGMNSHIAKPIDIDKMIETLSGILL